MFEILLKWIDIRDWENAFWAVIPKRKFQGWGRDQGEAREEDNAEQDDNGGGRGTDTGDGSENETLVTEGPFGPEMEGTTDQGIAGLE